jgi:hypothetical protein
MGPLNLQQQERTQHAQEIVHEAEMRRLVKQARQGNVGYAKRARHSIVRHAISRVGSWLVLLGTKLERVEPA